MGVVGDALQALQKVVVMQANIERLQSDFTRLSDDVRGLKDFGHMLDVRVARIEMLVEVTRGGGGGGGRGAGLSRIEG